MATVSEQVICTVIYAKLVPHYCNAFHTANNNNYSTSISDWGEITHGVPQGSVLGLLLFLPYINDLPHSINKNNKIVLFANDTSLSQIQIR
jgi:hypothetical protein